MFENRLFFTKNRLFVVECLPRKVPFTRELMYAQIITSLSTYLQAVIEYNSSTISTLVSTDELATAAPIALTRTSVSRV